MEDPWANAWGEPSKSTSTGNISNSWSSPSVSVIHGDHEDDLATPSWSFEPDIAWKHEESDVIETSVWKKDSNITTPWDPSPVISHETTLDTITTTPSPPPPETPLPSSEQSSRSTTPTRGLDSEEQPPPIVPPADPPEPPPLVTPLPPSLSIVTDDGDGFGTFETADESVGDPETANWSPSPHNLPLTSTDSTSWGGAWANVPSSPRDNQEEEGDDEWETAKRQKERLDRHVPPELLASILQQLESLSDDLWPLPNNEGTLDNTRNFDNEHLGLDAAMQRLVPADLSLPLPTPFDRTFISKQLSGALKLTRHTPLTRRGPMAMFMASKGSTTWEASIKAKPIVTQEDTAPAGWKIVDNTPEVPVATDSKKKVTGGLMSFFGRRGTTSSVETPVSPRQSADNARPSTPHANHKSSSSISSASAPPPPAAPSNPPEQLYGSTVVTSPIFEESTAAPAPAPSAVSRFFGRFSSHSSRRNSKDSIALSADDLEFLSDVPTANDGDKGPELDALSMMIKSPPLPTALPPPLPPPPKTTMVPARTSFVNTAKPKMPEDDVFDLFGDFEDRMSPGPAPPLMGPPVPPVKSVPLNSNHPSSVSPPPSTVDKVVQQESAWPAFDYPAMPAAKAPVASKKPIVAIMSSSNPSSTAAIPHLHFSKPPQPSLLSNGSNQIPFLPPPPSFSRSHTPLPTRAPATTVIKEEDEDDFADFLSSPPPNSSHQKQAFGSFAGVSSASGVNLTSGNQDLFANFDDDFGIFTSSSPPAPTPPAKSTSPPFQAAPRSGTPSSTSSPSPPSGSGLTRKISRKADHSRTLSLLETAAARGNWLGPPSPLPEALNPPPASSSSTDQTFGRNRASGEGKAPGLVTSNVPSSNSMPAVFSSNGFGQNGFNGTSLTSSAPRVAPLPPAANNNPISMPATQIKQPDWFSQAPLQAKPAATNTPSAQVGGLSAQDLSFFEGL